MALNDPNLRVVPFNMTEAGMKSLGLGDMNLQKHNVVNNHYLLVYTKVT